MADAHDAIVQQLRGEKASAMARAVERLEAALEALVRFDARRGVDGHAAAAGERAALFDEACERLWFVVIQREAMGLRRHEVLHDVLRIPAEVRSGMGPRRRSPRGA